MSRHPEVITFGESMGLMMPASGLQGLEYATTLQKSFGGAESNVAIGLSRLGCSAGWFGRLGEDPLGRNILKTIRGEGVDVSQAVLDKAAPTGLMLRESVYGNNSVYYYRKNSAASRMTSNDLNEDYIKSAKWLHITGITPALSGSCREAAFDAVKIAKKHDVTVCFDPNLRLKLWPLEEAREVLLALAEQSDYFLPGWDELKLLYDTTDEQSIRQKLRKLSAVTILKGSTEKTEVIQNGLHEEVACFPVDKVIDTVGAGDAFCAGFIAGMINQKSVTESVRQGNLCGALAVQAIGDWESFPDKAKVAAVLENIDHVER